MKTSNIKAEEEDEKVKKIITVNETSFYICWVEYRFLYIPSVTPLNFFSNA